MEHYENRLVRQELKTEQIEKVIAEMNDAVKEIRSVLSTLATLQVETAQTNIELRNTIENLSGVKKEINMIKTKADKGEQAYEWIIRGGSIIIATVLLALLGVVVTL